MLFFKVGVLKNFAVFTGKHLRWSLFLKMFQAFTFTTPTLVIFSKDCEIFKNSFLYRTPLAGASVPFFFFIRLAFF